MTREEAIEILKEIIDEGWLISDFDKCTAIDACEMAIEALEQEPILDKIRTEIEGKYQVVLIDIPKNDWAVRWNECVKEVIEVIDKYKAESKPKTGHWIRWYEQKEDDFFTEYIPHCKCSECGKEYDPHSSQFIKYCSECGVKMVEPQESEIKDGNNRSQKD